MSNKDRLRAGALIAMLLLVLLLTTCVQNAPLRVEMIQTEVR